MIFLASIGGYIFGKLLGSNCGLDCIFSDFGLIEYLLLFFVFILAYILGRKIIKILKNNDKT